MELTNIREIFRNKDKFADKEVTIGGWVRSNRNSKNFGFIVVNDGTFFEPIQVVYGNGLDNYDEVGKINVGAAIIVRGTLVLTPDAKQPFEIQAIVKNKDAIIEQAHEEAKKVVDEAKVYKGK